MMRLANAAFVAFGFLLGTASLASAETCTTLITGKTIIGDLVVPAGMACEIDSTTVNGSVRVEQGAYFYAAVSASGPVIIYGNVTAVQCGFVAFGSSSVSVDGNIQVEGCTGPSPTQITATTISGNVECISNSGACEIGGSTVGGNLQVNDNSGGAGVTDNYVGGNLQCVGNPPSALVVNNNTVAGNKQGQCASNTSQ
jgi:hypothetical protein